MKRSLLSILIPVVLLCAGATLEAQGKGELNLAKAYEISNGSFSPLYEARFKPRIRAMYLQYLADQSAEKEKAIKLAKRPKAREFRQELTGAITVGCFGVLAPYVLPGLLATCAERHPGCAWKRTRSTSTRSPRA